MRTIGRKIALGVGGVVGILLVLVVALALLAPRLMNAEALKGQFQAALLEKTGGQIDYRHAELSYFPRPKLEIQQISLSIPDTLSGSVKSLEIYPDLLSLLRGKLSLSGLEIGEPVFSLFLPAKARVIEEQPDSLSAMDFQRGISPLLAPLALHAPEMSLEIRNGTVVLSKQEQPVFSAMNLNLELDFSADGETTFRTDFQGTVPDLTIFRGEKKVVITGKSLKGSIRGDQGRITASLTELALTQPQLDVIGTFSADASAANFTLDVQGRNVDVEPTREAALALFGEYAVTRVIFDIVRGGTVPQISFQTRGKTPSELGKLENIVIRGRMQDGQIFVPAVDLDLEEVNGDVVIAEGILAGEDLSARLENSRGQQGELKIGLQGGDAPFHLGLMIDADLSQLLPILKRVVNNRAFIDELKRISKLRGEGRGRLVLGESLRSVEAKVDVESLHLTADYQRIPFPVDIRQGQFSFSKARVGIKNLAGNVGASNFSNLSYSLSWRDEIILDIRSGRFDLVLEELYPWVWSFEAVRERLEEVKAAKGRLELFGLSLKGPVNKPAQWRFDASGQVKEVTLETTLFPEEVQLAGGSFRWTTEELSFRDMQTYALDATLGLSGNVRDAGHGEVSLYGNIGPSAVQWLQNHLELPPFWAVHAPLALSRTEIGWHPGAALSFKGDVDFSKGPKVSAELSYRPRALSINRLSIHDQESSVNLSLNQKGNALELKFLGRLHQKTVDDIFVSQPFFTGWLAGDIQAGIVPDHPEKSNAQGKLQGGKILIPLKARKPVLIEEISVAAQGNHIDIANSVVSWEGQKVAFKGAIDVSSKGYVLDLDASSGELRWSDISQLLVTDKEKKGPERDTLPWNRPVSGEIRLSAESFRWDHYTWTPVSADISFGPEAVAIQVNRARLCGISTPGTLRVTGEVLSLDFQPSAINQQLATSYACLTEDRIRMSGTFDLISRITAEGKADALLDSAKGYLSFSAQKGQITRHKLFSRILEIVNITEIYKGKFPDLTRKGFPFDAITAKGHLGNGRFFLNEFFLDGETMEVVGSGEFDLGSKTMDVKLLVEPLKTVDTVIKKIPGISYLLGGSLVSIPVSAKGDLAAPGVTILSPSEVGAGLLNFAERVLKVPVKLIEPIIPATGTR